MHIKNESYSIKCDNCGKTEATYYQKHPWRVEDFFGRIKIVDNADCFATLKVAMSAARKAFK